MDAASNKLKILYIITKANYGGAQRYVDDLAQYGNSHGHEIVVAFGRTGLLEDRLKNSDIRTISIKSLSRDVRMISDLRSFFEIYSIIRKIKPDVIHLNSSKVGGIGALAGRLSNIVEHIRKSFRLPSYPAQIIFTGHGWALNEDRPDVQRFFIAFFHWITIILAHHTIVVSRKTRDEVAGLPFIWHKLRVIHNGTHQIETISRELALKQLLSNQSINSECVVIGTIAELHRNKGLTFAIDGIQTLRKQSDKQFIYIIIGEGEERRNLEQKINELGLTDTVFLCGFHDASKLLSAFDVFLFPSIKEGFPYAILEAGSVGLPIISSNVGGISEVINDMTSGILIHSKNSGEISRALKYMLDHPDKAAQFGKIMSEKVKDEFSSEKMSENTFALYRELINKRSQHATPLNHLEHPPSST